MGSRVTPYDIHIPSPKENNFVDKGLNIVSQIKAIIFIQALLGINRIFLLKYGRAIAYAIYIYTSLLFILNLYFLYDRGNSSNTYIIYKVTTTTEYLILIFLSLFTYKETLQNVFMDLTAFDDMLNISKESHNFIQIKGAVLYMFLSLTYFVTEFAILSVFVEMPLSYTTFILNLSNLAHDSEQIFFVILIRTIMIRVRILKGHIAKSFNTEKDEDNEEFHAIEDLSKNIQLDTTKIHRAYEQLHKCADELNSAMGFPMIVMLFFSGLGTTLLLKTFLQMTEETNPSNTTTAMLIFTSVRSIKYTLLIIFPCYYASITSRQVMRIRTMLHNAVNTLKLEKIERRKLKAFFQLTQDNEFAYALWGVIRLSMSLPLSYASLCTTYLVIIIQFSKFID